MSDRPRYLVIVQSVRERTPALFRAMALAKQSGAELMLALFDYDAALNKAKAKGFDLAAFLEGRRRQLEEFAGHLRQEGFPVSTTVHWGNRPAEQILEVVAQSKPDLVIKDVHAEPPLKRLVLAGRDFDLLRLCPVPLMLVKPGSRNLPAHIAAAVDPLDENGRPHGLNTGILDAAEKYGMLCGAPVEVVHAFDSEPDFANAAAFGGWSLDPALLKDLRAQHERALRELGSKQGVEERHLHLLAGFPPKALADFTATYGIDLLVMGTVHRTGLEHFMLGSVAEQLLDRLDCDVLAVKTHT